MKSPPPNIDRKVTRLPSVHISGELYDGHPASSGNMNDADDFDMILRDPPTSDLPSRVRRHIAVSHALSKEIIHRATDDLHEARHADRIPCVCLVSGVYLAFPVTIAGPIDPDLYRCPSAEWREAIRVMEIAIAAAKDVWQLKPYATIAVDEKNG